MRTHIIGLSALAAALSAAPALAQDATPTAPPSAFTISGGATVVSDYRFRGISQTDKRFAVQGTLGVSHESGAYVGVWGSSIDDYVAFGSDQEIDIYGGYKKTFGGTTVDGGVLYYYYPGSHGNNSDFFEPYVSATHTFGPVSAKVGAAYAWNQHAIAIQHDRDDNLYLYGEGSIGVPNTGFTVTGHLGHTFGRSVLSDGLKGYYDWNVTGAYAWKNLTFSIAYVDTDIKDREFELTNGRHPTKGGVLGSVGVAF